ncbi:MAG: PadR family transcriptional regulator [Sphingopyxis sp.]
MLGKLEEEVLLATLLAGDGALPSEIYVRIEAATGKAKPPAFGAVYTTLGRMVSKRLLIETSKTDAADRSRRAFTVSALGRRALADSMDRIRSLGGFALAGGTHA